MGVTAGPVGGLGFATLPTGLFQLWYTGIVGRVVWCMFPAGSSPIRRLRSFRAQPPFTWGSQALKVGVVRSAHGSRVFRFVGPSEPFGRGTVYAA